jgi:hypothetical protein
MSWKDAFQAALVELDPAKIPALIHEAEMSMAERSNSLPAASSEELQAISDATWTLRILKNHVMAGSV